MGAPAQQGWHAAVSLLVQQHLLPCWLMPLVDMLRICNIRCGEGWIPEGWSTRCRLLLWLHQPVMLAQDSSNSSCLPSMPGQRVQSGLLGVMSGARDGNLSNQVRGEPETVAGSSAGSVRHSWSLNSNSQQVKLSCLTIMVRCMTAYVAVCSGVAL